MESTKLMSEAISNALYYKDLEKTVSDKFN